MMCGSDCAVLLRSKGAESQVPITCYSCISVQRPNKASRSEDDSQYSDTRTVVRRTDRRDTKNKNRVRYTALPGPPVGPLSSHAALLPDVEVLMKRFQQQLVRLLLAVERYLVILLVLFFKGLCFSLLR
mmetsp:Transcript_28909/g.63666  ORF Transcript_28909/g.63666 Transcript_28909/m.63666 type:complete len:129 (-) Transcript_28909:80-466(-)